MTRRRRGPHQRPRHVRPITSVVRQPMTAALAMLCTLVWVVVVVLLVVVA